MGQEYSLDLSIANSFNDYFCNVPEELNNSLPTSNANPFEHIVENNLGSLYLYRVSSGECSEIIQDLKITKTDLDCIPIFLFKKFKSKFIKVICEIVNLCFSQGKFPDFLKLATVIPIFKQGDRVLISNYRPISLLHFLSKIIEKCFKFRLLNFVSKLDILTPHQFGFLSGKSTAHAVSHLAESIYCSLNEKLTHVNIFIDLRKAFDTVNKDILLKKLELYGIRWIPNRLYF